MVRKAGEPICWASISRNRHVLHLADEPAIDESLCLDQQRAVMQAVRYGNDPPRLPCLCVECPRLLDRVGYGFLDHDVAAGIESGNGVIRMQRVGRGYNNGNQVLLEQFAIIRCGVLESEVALHAVQDVRIEPASR